MDGPFTGLDPRAFRKLITMLRRKGAEVVRHQGTLVAAAGGDRVLLVAAY